MQTQRHSIYEIVGKNSPKNNMKKKKKKTNYFLRGILSLWCSFWAKSLDLKSDFRDTLLNMSL